MRALEAHSRDSAPDNAEVLAHHALRGELWSPAATHLYRAGAKAHAEARYPAARAFYEGAIDALRRLGDGADRTLEVDAYLELWSTRISTGYVEGLSDLGATLDRLARALDDGPRLARVQVRHAQAIAFAAAIPGTLHSALDRAREAATRADASDVRTRSYARFIAAVACRDLGRVAEALDEFGLGTKDIVSAADRIDEPGLVYPIFVSLCGWRSEAEAALGRFDAAFASATEAVRMASQIKHPSSVAIAAAFLGYVHLVKGQLDEAIPILERGLAVSEEHDLFHGVGANGLYLGWSTLLRGDRARGAAYLARGLARLAGSTLQWTRFGAVTAAAYLAGDQLEDARRVLAGAFAAVAERDARGYRAPLLRLEAEVLLRAGDVDGARSPASDALAIASELALPPEIAHCHATLARVATRRHDATSAGEHRGAARLIFDELGMTFWADRIDGS